MRVANLFPYAVLCVNDRLEILYINDEGSTLLQRNDGLGRKGTTLTIEQRRKATEVQHLIKSGSSAHQNASGIVLVPRRSMRRPFELLITSIQKKSLDPGEDRLSILMIFDHDKTTQANESVTSRLYGLTSAEARVVTLLLQDKTLDEISQILHKAKETVRKQLQSIFAKTNTRRQSELVNLLLTGPAVLNVRDQNGTQMDCGREK
jgi:DNA-binding CsgD family transcriptional regulator